jgi:hypothetical protein
MQRIHAPKAREVAEIESAEQVLDRIDRDASGALVVQPQLRVGRADDAYEREADLVAARVVSGLTDTAAPVAARRSVQRTTADATIGAAGGPVPVDTERTIEAMRGRGRPLPDSVRPSLESALGSELGGVRVHTDDTADALNRSMQANAFTTGNDIFFRSGQYDPTSTAGVGLLAHEATHVVQQSPMAARRTVRRDLAPATSVVFETMAEKSGDGAKTTIRSPRYVKVRSALRTYMAKSGSKDNKWRAKELKSMLSLIEDWLADKKNASGAGAVVDARREAFNWLAPKIAAEFVTVDSIVANSKGGAKGATDKGGMSEVELGVKTKGSIGTSKKNTGVFKAVEQKTRKVRDGKDENGKNKFREEEYSYTAGSAPAAADSGIDTKDAKFTERAIAGTGLAKLMGTEVVAEAIKAERNGKQGYMMEQVAGVQPKGERKIRPANDMEERDWTAQVDLQPDAYARDDKGVYKKQDQVNVINWKDPVLQEKLVELQLYDAITGQVDRHVANYFVDQGPGKETSVKGIDPDLAFGKDKGVDQVKTPMGNTNDKSMEELPPIVSKSTYDRIMGMTDSDVTSLLGRLLSPAEVAQAVVRLQQVKAHLRGLEASGLVFNSFQDEDENFRLNRFTEKNSYIGRDMYWQARTLFTQSGKVVNF